MGVAEWKQSFFQEAVLWLAALGAHLRGVNRQVDVTATGPISAMGVKPCQLPGYGPRRRILYYMGI